MILAVCGGDDAERMVILSVSGRKRENSFNAGWYKDEYYLAIIHDGAAV